MYWSEVVTRMSQIQSCTGTYGKQKDEWFRFRYKYYSFAVVLLHVVSLHTPLNGTTANFPQRFTNAKIAWSTINH